jgi:hypothetical protein
MAKILVKYPRDFKSIKMIEFYPEAALMDIIKGEAAAVETIENASRKSLYKSFFLRRKNSFSTNAPKA